MNSFILLMNSYLGCFQYFTILNNVAVSILVRVHWYTCTHISPEYVYIPRNATAGSEVIILSNLLDNAKLFSTGTVPIYVSLRP